MNNLHYDVIICTYNGEKYIREQILSILSQYILPDKIIISDDFSQDNTLEVIFNVFKERRYNKFEIIQGQGKGVKVNFLSSLQYSTSEYTFLADQDDIWHVDKVRVFSNYLKSIDIPFLVFSDCSIINEKYEVVSSSFFDYQGLTEEILNDDSILFKNCVQGASSCINKALRELVIYSLSKVNIENIFIHDRWIAIFAKYYGMAVFIPYSLMDYRQHSNNQIGVFNKKIKLFFYVRYLFRFLKNFILTVRQKNEFEIFDEIYKSSLPSKSDREYLYLSSLKVFFIKLLHL